MKKLLSYIVLSALSTANCLASGEIIRISHNGIIDYASTEEIDSIYFDEQNRMMIIQPRNGNGSVSLSYPDVTDVSYVAESELPSKIKVCFSGEAAQIENPFLLHGVSVKADGGYVSITNSNTETELTTELSGSSTNGSFTYNGDYKTTIVLNGVSITSKKGAAIDIECGKRVNLELKKGTENTLSDLADGSQKAALYCKGHLEIDKAGTLNVTGNAKHAISAKEYIQLKKSTGVINILGAKSDGMHCGQYFLAKGYTVNVSNVMGDGIQAEMESIASGESYEEDYDNGSLQIIDGTFTVTCKENGGEETESDGTKDTYYSTCLKADKLVAISGGTMTLTNSGSMSKSIKAGNSSNAGSVAITGGDVTCNISGDMYVLNSDATYCTAIKCDTYSSTDGTVTINASTGKATRGISADSSVDIKGGTYKITNSSAGNATTSDNYTAKGITCDKNISITGGSLNIKMTGTGGKCIKADGTITIGEKDAEGPQLTVATSGSSLSGSSSTGGNTGGRPGWGGWGGGFPGGSSSSGSSSKAIKAQGAVTVNSGNLLVTTTTDGAEGLESKTSVTINGGTHYFKCYDDCINSSGIVNFAGGTTACYSYGNDAVDSNYGKKGAITISGGNVFAYTTKGSPEEGLDCDNNSYIVITGGIAVSAGGSQGGGGGWGGSSSSQSVGSSTQGYFLGASPSSYATTYYYTLCNTSGKAICTYKFEATTSNALSLLTASDLGKGSVTVKYSTSAPTSYSNAVKNASGTAIFFIDPTVTTTGTTATITSK